MNRFSTSKFKTSGTTALFSLLLFFSQQAQSCDSNNSLCTTAIDVIESVLDGSTSCITGCNVSDTPGYFDRESIACQGSPFGTAWYRISAHSSSRILSVDCTSTELSNPVIVIYEGTCDELIAIDCNRSSAYTVELKNILFESNKTYWIAVSSADGTEGEFDLCTTFSEDENVCNIHNTLAVKSTSKGSDFSGPFQPGEAVELCYKISGFQNVSCNYLQGIVPFFGEGWDPASFTSAGEPANITQRLETQGNTSFTTANPICEGDPAGTWVWYESGPIEYNLNSENPMGYISGQNIASGWIFVNSFDPSCFDFDDACCTNPTPDPNLGYGDDDYPLCGTGMTQEWEVCMTLVTRSNPSCDTEMDCMVGFKSFSDGELGAYISKSCKTDRTNYFNAASTCCEAPILTAVTRELVTCPDDAVTFELNSDDPDARFYWYDTEGLLHISSDYGSIDLELSASENGIHTFEIFATNGCTSEALVVVLNVESSIAATITQEPEIACAGEPVRLMAQLDDMSLISEATFVWNDQNSSTDSEIIIDEDKNSYEVEVAYKNCSVMLEHDLVTYPVSSLEMEGSAVICAGDRAFLKLALSGAGPWSVVLETNEGEQIELELNDATYLEAIETDSDMRYEILSATDANGCLMEWQGDFDIEVTPALDISAGEDKIIYCDQHVELVGVMLSPVLNYEMQWIDDQGQLLEPIDDKYLVDIPGTYILRTVDQMSCVTSDTISVIRNPDALEVNLPQGSDIFVSEGSNALLEVSYNLPSSEIASISWSGPEGFECDDCLSAMITPDTDLEYMVEVTDIHGCTELRKITVTITDKQPKYYIPTVFQPSQGGEDAKFTIFGEDAISKIISMTIYDRWGNLVFESYDNLAGEERSCWDGTKNGKNLAQGVYVYQFVLELSTGQTKAVQGQLTLLN